MSTEFPTKRIKFCDLVIMGQSPEGTSVNLENNGVPFLQGNAEFGDVSPIATQATTDPRKLCQQGDVLLSVRAPVGAVNVADQTYAIGRGLCAIRPRLHDGIFLRYLLKTQAETLNSFATGTTFTAVSAPQVGQLYVPFPALSEQRRISAYLDEQTGKIDRLMEMRRRQMALLKEQRAALIQQAVTRGLNPNASMKDSDLPWLGEIPAHWEVIKLKYLARFQSGDSITSDEIDESGDYPVFGGNGLRGYTSSYTHEGRYVLVGRQGALCGNVNYAIGKFWASEHAVVASLVSGNEVVWFGEMLRVMNLNQYSQSAAQPGLAVEKIQNLYAPVPPHSEQLEITIHIETESAKLENLLSAYARQLSLLAEYRTALIHECVTGQRSVSQRTVVEATPTKANIPFLRAVLCSEIVHRLHQEPTFGRVKLEKFLYLSEAYAGIDLEGKYQRAAAGPFDNQALRSAESQIQKQKWYQPVKGEKGTRYLPMEKAGGHQKYFARYWPEQQPKFDRLFNLLRSFDTERCEIVATLFAVWKDRLRADQPCPDADIVDEVLTKWHPSKQRIPRDRWLSALKWMRQEGLAP